MAKKKVDVFMPELTPQERLEYMQNNCYKQDNRTYQQPLSDGEIRQRLDQFVDNAQKISLLEEELKGIKANFKGQIDPIKGQNKELMVEIKTKHKEALGRVFMMANYNEKRMYTYNEDGVEIDVRRLYPEEMQTRTVIPLRSVQGGQSEGGVQEDDNDDADQDDE